LTVERSSAALEEIAPVAAILPLIEGGGPTIVRDLAGSALIGAKLYVFYRVLVLPPRLELQFADLQIECAATLSG